MTSCRICGCTDEDCRQCIEKTGEPCCWIEDDLCSACVRSGDYLREQLDEMVLRGECSRRDADEAFTFFDQLSDKEIRGEVTTADALAQVENFATACLRRKNAS